MGSPREHRRVVFAWILSACGHIGLLSLAGYLALHSFAANESRVAWAQNLPNLDGAIEVELPGGADGAASEQTRAPEEATPLERGGGERTPRIDSSKPGRGGTDG